MILIFFNLINCNLIIYEKNRLNLINNTITSFSILFSFFQNISFLGNGGAIYLEYSNSNTIIELCSFLNCNTKSLTDFMGGGINIGLVKSLLISKTCGSYCFSGHGQFAQLNLHSNSPNNINLISVDRCPNQQEGMHQSFRPCGNITCKNNNFSNNYLYGHSTIRPYSSDNTFISFCLFFNNKGGFLIEITSNYSKFFYCNLINNIRTSNPGNYDTIFYLKTNLLVENCCFYGNTFSNIYQIITGTYQSINISTNLNQQFTFNLFNLNNCYNGTIYLTNRKLQKKKVFYYFFEIFFYIIF